ncbi:O-antigen ligase family protein [Leptothoe kymatousa]|uniref:O-antigen ligase family protein n=1 Tax=Leptothoe kymatousa TAU-MAC 1615 TaxID=2364775 RepID=A0ABS5Y5C1_9CYAN|nr:O-antigen ligase family protein [Leptothoe kymatousa]MBT9313013.1 O-antigen ligase family protein [Leptothoe kymatousa TAU-MAC 1615]
MFEQKSYRETPPQNPLSILDAKSWYDWLWLGALVVLPFASYLSLAILVTLMLVALWQRGPNIRDYLWHQGYGLLTLGLVISACFAVNQSDGWLQLANFLPYFLLVGVLATAPRFRQSDQFFTTAAQALVLGSFPFSMAALVEYVVRFPSITAQVGDWAIFQWIFDVSFAGHRAHGGLSHPNILGNYLVIILGLGLGLLLANRHSKLSSKMVLAVAMAVALAGIGIFCTSSRNGLLAALVLLAIAGYCARQHRWVWLLGLGVLGAMAAGLATLGFGGRAISLGLFTNDPRIAAWQISWDLIQQRPLMGWGLGGFSDQYVPFSVTDHERLFHPHNLWLYLAGDTGIPTMLMACWVVGRSYVGGIRCLTTGEGHPILLSYVLAFTGCILFALFDVTLFDARINVLSWFIVASIGILASRPQATTSPAAAVPARQKRR